MTEVRTVVRQIQQLEIYLNNLVSALTRGELPVNLQPVTQIFDNAISSLPPILNLSEERFIDTYNDIPQILTAYAIDVTLSEDSYRSISDNITFNRFHRGNYWIIASTELIEKAWLVPNPLKDLSFDRMPSLDASFDRDTYNVNRNTDVCFLEKPALVQILPIVKSLTWQLTERGKLTSNKTKQSSSVITSIESSLDKLTQSNNRNEYDIKMLANRLYRHRDDINSLQKTTPQISTEHHLEYKMAVSNGRLDKQRDDIDAMIEDIREIKSILINENAIANLQANSAVIDTLDFDSSWQNSILEEVGFNGESHRFNQILLEIISDYYHNPREFTTKYQVKIANITKDCINANRGKEEKNIILEETNRGNYWIFNFENYNYLVPVEDKYINQHSYITTSTIFEGHNYTPDYQKIQLIKPAIVSINSNTNPQTWQLQQQGELIFL